MGDYMKDQGWHSSYLKWYVNYCCLDDYGCKVEDVSAWAGIHYFASRNGRGSNISTHSVLTWPEGNGWIVKKIREKIQSEILTQSLVFNIEELSSGDTAVDCYHASENLTIRYLAKAVIFSAPQFVAKRVLQSYRHQTPTYLEDFQYAPWLVANITLDEMPAGNGAPLSWDNVTFGSPSIGYVVATHQNVRRYPPRKTVLTYYLPLSGQNITENRRQAASRNHAEWMDFIIKDLEKTHPGIRGAILNLDLWQWGHGMVRPVPGFIWGSSRKMASRPIGNILFAHSDLSGISIFEEAHYRGIEAANQVVHRLKGNSKQRG
jgi:hypothetical protein